MFAAFVIKKAQVVHVLMSFVFLATSEFEQFEAECRMTCPPCVGNRSSEMYLHLVSSHLVDGCNTGHPRDV